MSDHPDTSPSENSPVGLVSGPNGSLTVGYHWRRLWVPREGVLDLSDHGFPQLPDEERRLVGLRKHDAVYFNAIANTPCLILLGEPGMGKTYALREERRAVETRSDPNTSKTLFLDLRSYSSENRLIRDLFESPSFLGWIRGAHRLHVVLDSLDECLLRIDTIATLLGDKFQALPSVFGLSLRIACRTAEWSPVLEKALCSKWGDKAFGVFEIVPLTRPDVIEAANANALDSHRFLEEVAKREVAPLAFKPVTLEFLLRSFRENRQLPASQCELYAKGCRLLCAETNESRAYSSLRGRLTPEQRLAIAGRIASVTIFCNRSAIWRVDMPAPEGDITIDELCGEHGSNRVSRDDVLETLGTGLFSSRGPDRMGWAHQTYAEFLAARYLVEQGMPAEQMFTLLMHRGDAEPRLVPQLHETAAWLATMNRDVFTAVVKSDPEVLLRSDIATAAAEDQAVVVDAVLQAWHDGKLSDNNLYARYHKLFHPGLVGQLRPWILDRARSALAREAAIEIAQACTLKEIDSDLALLALDSTENYHIRTAAARCIVETADEAIKARLKPLAIAPTSNDPFDSLKGFALRACWPRHLSSKELFEALTPPDSNAMGAYHMFLAIELPMQLDAADILVALQWMKQRARGGPFEKLEEAILRVSISHLHQPDVRELFASVAVDMLRHDLLPGHKGEREELLTNDERYAVVDSLLPLMSENDVVHLLFGNGPLVTRDDVGWMIGRASCLESEQAETIIAHILTRLFDRSSVAQIAAMLELARTRHTFATIFAPFFDPVKLDSVEASRHRDSYQQETSWELNERRRQETALLKPLPEERIALLLQQVHDGNIDAWWRITMELTLSPTSRHYHDVESMDLTDTPGWRAADSATRYRLLVAGKNYIEQRDAAPDRWFSEKDIYHRPAMAGLKAFLLLAKEAPSALSQLPPETWKRWVPIIVAAPEFSHREQCMALTEAVYKAAPAETIDWLLRTMERQNQETGDLAVLSRFEGIFDEQLGAALFSRIKSADLRPDAITSILRFLLKHKVAASEQFARALLALPLPKEGSARDMARIVAGMLLKHGSNSAWDVIWATMLQDPSFGHMLWTQVAYDAFGQPADAVGNLSESQIAELYIWMMSEFPPEKDGSPDMDGHVSPRDAIAHFRDALIPNLRERGTPEGCAAIERLMHQFPSFDWLKRVLVQAQERTRRKSWQPPKPVELFALAANHKLRLVRNGDELLELVIDALHRIEGRFQSEGLVQFLWDKVDRNTFQPKDENALSDFVKAFLDVELRQRGIVVNREVETRRGEETDIYVDALVRGQGEQFDKVSVVIETKGCWHREVRDAIETQLVNRYLKDSACRHGLYLIGWFSSPKWADSDHRKRIAATRSTVELQEALTTKARALSTGGLQVHALLLNAALL